MCTPQNIATGVYANELCLPLAVPLAFSAASSLTPALSSVECSKCSSKAPKQLSPQNRGTCFLNLHLCSSLHWAGHDPGPAPSPGGNSKRLREGSVAKARESVLSNLRLLSCVVPYPLPI